MLMKCLKYTVTNVNSCSLSVSLTHTLRQRFGGQVQKIQTRQEARNVERSCKSSVCGYQVGVRRRDECGASV